MRRYTTGHCAAAYFERCAANPHKGGYNKDGPHKDGRHTEIQINLPDGAGAGKPNWRTCAVCMDSWCTFCTPDRVIDIAHWGATKGYFECPECVNSSAELDYALYGGGYASNHASCSYALVSTPGSPGSRPNQTFVSQATVSVRGGFLKDGTTDEATAGA